MLCHVLWRAVPQSSACDGSNVGQHIHSRLWVICVHAEGRGLCGNHFVNHPLSSHHGVLRIEHRGLDGGEVAAASLVIACLRGTCRTQAGLGDESSDMRPVTLHRAAACAGIDEQAVMGCACECPAESPLQLPSATVVRQTHRAKA